MNEYQAIGDDVRFDDFISRKQGIRELDGDAFVEGCRIHACERQSRRRVVP